MNKNECKHFDRFVIFENGKRNDGGKKAHKITTTTTTAGATATTMIITTAVWSFKPIAAWWENDSHGFCGRSIRFVLVLCQFNNTFPCFGFYCTAVFHLYRFWLPKCIFLSLPLSFCLCNTETFGWASSDLILGSYVPITEKNWKWFASNENSTLVAKATKTNVNESNDNRRVCATRDLSE